MTDLTPNFYRFFQIMIMSCFFLIACNPKKDAPLVSKKIDLPKNNLVKGDATDVNAIDRLKIDSLAKQSWDGFNRRKVISRFELDDRKFYVLRLTLGYQDFLQSKSPIITFDPPKNADFFEIMRCSKEANIGSELDNFDIKDLEAQTSYQGAELSALYRNNDIWGKASQTDGCEVIHMSLTGHKFMDSWAPSGSYRYLVRACVSPSRLVDDEKLSSRFCSRQVAISQLLENYQNNRDKEHRKALAAMETADAALQRTGLTWYHLVEEYGEAVQECEKREFWRMVNSTKRLAIVSVTASGLGLLYEISTVIRTKEIDFPLSAHMWRQYGLGKKKAPMEYFGATMDKAQLSAEAGGMTFLHVFTELSTHSEDTPRTCVKALRLDFDVQKNTEELVWAILQFDYFRQRAEAWEEIKSSAAGESTQKEQPQLNPDMLNSLFGN